MPVITSLCRTARIAEIINQMVKWNEDKARVSPGILIEALLVYIMCCRKTFWKVSSSGRIRIWGYCFKAVDLAYDQLNDDAPVLALDRGYVSLRQR